jgi:hypothetical protein
MFVEDSDSGDFRRKLTTPFYLPHSDPRSEEGDFASYSYGEDGDKKKRSAQCERAVVEDGNIIDLPKPVQSRKKGASPKAAKDGQKTVRGDKKKVNKTEPRENYEESWPEYMGEANPFQPHRQQQDHFQQQDPYQQHEQQPYQHPYQQDQHQQDTYQHHHQQQYVWPSYFSCGRSLTSSLEASVSSQHDGWSLRFA